MERDDIVMDGNGCTLQGLGNETGIYLSDRENVTVRNTQITGFHSGIRLYSCSNNVISGNNITASSYAGIYLEYSSNNGVSGNSMGNNSLGIRLWYSNYNSISGNNITTSYFTGISLRESSHNGIIGNDIANNNQGINIYVTSNYNVVRGNSITANVGGIWLLNAFNNNIRENNITASSYAGILLEYGSSDNILYHNNLIDNSIQALAENSSGNLWDHGYPSGGNYWSDYTGVDADGDGIGDTPYVINAENRDNYPLMGHFIKIQIPGDINNDDTVDIFDCVIIAIAFGSTPSDSNWNPFADTNSDGIVDTFDMVDVALHFGETD